MIEVLNPIGNGGESLRPPRARAPHRARMNAHDRSAEIDSGCLQFASHRLPRRFRREDLDRWSVGEPASQQRPHDLQIRLDFMERRPRSVRAGRAARDPLAESHAAPVDAAACPGEKRKEERPPIPSELDDRRVASPGNVADHAKGARWAGRPPSSAPVAWRIVIEDPLDVGIALERILYYDSP